MQVVEKLNEGLSRVLEVTIAKDQLTLKLDAKIAEIAPKMNIKGFRPGKVPQGHVRKMYGKELMSEIVQETLNETTQKALDQASIRPASQPELTPIGDIEQVIKGNSDLAYSIAVEMMPIFTPVEPASIELTRPVYTPSDADIDEALKNVVSQTKQYEAKAGKGKAAPKAEDGDKLIIDFVGKIGDEAFEGGSAEDAELVIGSGQFIPGFEEQLVGAKKGETKTLNVTFPENYGAKNLAGKEATFETTVKDILAAKEGEADDELAKTLGLESLDALKNILKTQLEQQFNSASRFKMKRALLDVLDEKHDFELPSRMLEAEFQGIWGQVEQDKANGQLSEEDAAKSEEDLKAEYRKIAERRVRLGLVLAEIGTRQNVQVTDQEVTQAIMQEARNYPGQERQVFDFYRNNPAAAAQIRAPIYEEKVCDLIFTLATVTDSPISKEDLLKEDDEA
ncbi:trigger factor [Asticcacaulis biprosthecium C19]|uniref:Trigger factor n=1 Tax=Asticcacaulis biprosthecium C19 TaxID=715226 RepID=F4QQF6_9CAUL|nr:trigger factor [Asticcacaulis biprosthecium]EGF90443.1 trigger factor [Asticcacaulis biprosthecium C19]